MANSENLDLKRLDEPKASTNFNHQIYYQNNFDKIDAAMGAAPSTLTTEAKTLVPAIIELQSDKVDKVEGKGLSTNDFDNTYKQKIDTDIPAQLADVVQIIKPLGLGNDSPNINTIIQNGGNFLIKKGNYYLNEDINVKSNTTITFEKGAIFYKNATDSEIYYIINIFECDNVVINDAYIVGDKDIHIGTTGEWGNGINICNSDNVIINNPIVIDCWGDGIYIGVEYHSTSLKESGTTIINDAYVDDCRRNGLSICSGRQITINNPIIKNILGTAPKAGIDIEPESSGAGLLPYLDSVIINNPITENCEIGATIYLGNLIDRGLTTSIVINNHIDNISDYPLFIKHLVGTLKGKINIIKPIYKNSKRTSIVSDGYNAINTPKITIDTPTIIDFNSTDFANDFLNSAISIINVPTNVDATYDIGNIDIINPHIENSLAITRKRNILIKNYISGYRGKNINIINPTKMIKEGILSLAVIEADNINLLDKLKQFLFSSSDLSINTVGNAVYTNYDNKGATGTIIYDLTSAYPDEVEVTFEVKSPNNMRIVPEATASILPTYSVGKYISANVVGSSITLKKSNNNWIIVKQIGVWTPQV